MKINHLIRIPGTKIQQDVRRQTQKPASAASFEKHINQALGNSGEISQKHPLTTQGINKITRNEGDLSKVLTRTEKKFLAALFPEDNDSGIYNRNYQKVKTTKIGSKIDTSA